MEGGREQNYWPGFVDALSNVVLTLVFVLVVFVFALSMAANKVEKRMQDVIKAEEGYKAKVEADKAAAAQNGSGESEQTAVTAVQKNVEVVAEEKQSTKTNRGAVDVVNGSDKIVLTYPLGVVDMNDKSADALDAVLDATQKKSGAHNVLIRSITGKESYSVALRLAYYRALYMRNHLIAKGIGNQTTIHSKVVQAAEAGPGHVEIIFQSK